MSATFETRHDRRVLIATHADPATRNALSAPFYDAFGACLEAAAADPATGALVLTGAGGFFCSGGNVAGLHERTRQPETERGENVARLHRVVRAMRRCPKPIVAAVEGGAAGAGASLALACDLIVAARDAYFSVAYVRIGLTPDGGATHFLGRLLPRQLATEMALTGERVDAARLHALGVVNALAEPGAALEAAVERAAALADGPPAAMASIKALIESSRDTTLDEQLDREAESIVRALGGAEAREGIEAFLGKRRARFAHGRTAP